MSITKVSTSNYRVKNISFSALSFGFLTCVIVQLFTTAPAKADCIYGGETFKTGAERGPYICMPDGLWQPR